MKVGIMGRMIGTAGRALRDPDTLMGALAIALVIGASLACATGDTTGTSSTSSAANALQPALGAAGNEFFANPDANIIVQVAEEAGAAGLDANGQATNGITSLRVYTDRGNYSALTDANGRAVLSVKGGVRYNVFVIRNGHKTQVTEGVFVAAGQTVTAPTLTFTATTKLAAGEQTYIGSGRCITCHYGMTKGDAQIKAWLNSAHRSAMMAPEDSPGMLAKVRTAFSSGLNMSTVPKWISPTNYGANAPVLSKTGDTYYVTFGGVSHAVKYVMGFRDKQRYVTQIGSAHYILPIQYNVESDTWVLFHPEYWYSDTTPRYTSATTLETSVYKLHSWERRCIGCHGVTGVMALSYGPSATSGIEQHQSTYLEKGIGCEACHGPGSDHIAGPSTSNIINPKNLSNARALDICGQCHSRGLSVGYLPGLTTDTYRLEFWHNGTRTFRPGDTVVVGYTDGTTLWDKSYAENWASSGHRQQWNDMQQSGHTATGAAMSVNCGSCHNTHGPVGSLPNQISSAATDNSLCLTCHGATGNANQRFATDSSVLDHMGSGHTTYQPGTTGTGRCVTCHMPYSAKTGSIRDVHSHTFRVLRPRATYRWLAAGLSTTDPLPNSCQQSCHNGTGSETTFTASAPAATTIDGVSVRLPDLASAAAADTQWSSTIDVSMQGRRSAATDMIRLWGTVAVQNATSASDTAGVWVTVDHTSKSWVTNRDGLFSLLVDSGGTNGRFMVRAWKSGYESAALRVIINNTTSPRDSYIGVLTLAASDTNNVSKPFRCGACHGGTVGGEWYRSGFYGHQQSLTYLNDTSQIGEVSKGHGAPIYQYSAANFKCVRCHDPGADSGTAYGLRNSDTSYIGLITTYAGRDVVTREGVQCMVCHGVHGENSNPFNLVQYRTTAYQRNYFHAPDGDTPGSMGYPPSYNAAACFWCHNARQLTNAGAAGGPTNASDEHYSGIIDAYFGIDTSAVSYTLDSSGFILRYDSGTPNFCSETIRTALSTHRTAWGTQFTNKAIGYTTAGPRLLTAYRAGDATTKTDRFTCLTCHMFRRPAGYTGNVAFKAEYGHTWKPDVRVCAQCHDPAVVGAGGLNPSHAMAGATTGWGTTWGISSSGRSLGFYRTADKDYDGNGTISSIEIELRGLVARVDAALCNGTATFEDVTGTSAIIAPAYPGIETGLGHTLPSSTISFITVTRFGGSDALKADARRAVWNRNNYYYNHKNLSIHNPRWAITVLREAWAVIGRHVQNDSTWVPPGQDY